MSTEKEIRHYYDPDELKRHWEDLRFFTEHKHEYRLGSWVAVYCREKIAEGSEHQDVVRQIEEERLWLDPRDAVIEKVITDEQFRTGIARVRAAASSLPPISRKPT